MNQLHPSFFKAPIAHRGLHNAKNGVIENSLGAIKAAINGGYGIEIDIQPSSDLTPMVFHDYLLDRLTGQSGPIKSHTTDALGEIKLVGSDESIPTLSEVLNVIDGQVPLLVEIKDQDMRLGPDIGNFQDHVCNVLKDYTGPLAVMSFSPASMARVKELAPDLSIGLVTDPFKAEDWPNVPEARRHELASIPVAESIDIDFISHQQKDLGSPVVAKLKSRGLPIFCWTIRSAEDETRARKIADNVTFEGYVPARQD